MWKDLAFYFNSVWRFEEFILCFNKLTCLRSSSVAEILPCSCFTSCYFAAFLPYHHHYSTASTVSGTVQCRTEKLTGKQQKVWFLSALCLVWYLISSIHLISYSGRPSVFSLSDYQHLCKEIPASLVFCLSHVVTDGIDTNHVQFFFDLEGICC